MVITDECKNLIEKMVVSNKRFRGNEDLFEDFCSEALERSLFILKKTDKISRIENYLNKLISTAIISVLKNSGRIERTAEGYIKSETKKISLENPLDNGFIDIKDTSINIVEKIIEEETLKEIYSNILQIDKSLPEEKYGQIFYLKYVQNKKQREIAAELNISQGEVSKRLFKLMQLINKNMTR